MSDFPNYKQYHIKMGIFPGYKAECVKKAMLELISIGFFTDRYVYSLRKTTQGMEMVTWDRLSYSVYRSFAEKVITFYH